MTSATRARERGPSETSAHCGDRIAGRACRRRQGLTRGELTRGYMPFALYSIQTLFTQNPGAYLNRGMQCTCLAASGAARHSARYPRIRRAGYRRRRSGTARRSGKQGCLLSLGHCRRWSSGSPSARGHTRCHCLDQAGCHLRARRSQSRSGARIGWSLCPRLSQPLVAGLVSRRCTADHCKLRHLENG